MTSPNTSFLYEIRTLSRPIWILSIGTFFDRFGFFAVPFLVIFLTNEGMSKELAGVAAGLIGVGGIGAAVLGGFLADRIGRRRTIAISMLGGALATLALYFSAVESEHLGGFWLTFVVAIAYGLVRGMYHAASSSLVADLAPPNQLVAAFTILRFAINLGFALGMGAAALLFYLKSSFLWLYGIDAATSLIFGVIALTSLPHGVQSRKEESGWLPALQSLRGNRRFLGLCLNTFVVALILNQWGTSFAYHLNNQEGFPPEIYGIIMAANGLLIVFFEIPISARVRRLSAPNVIAAGTAVAAIGFGLNAFVPGVAGWLALSTNLSIVWLTTTCWVLTMTVFTVGEMITFPMQGAYVAVLAPEKMRGRYNGATGLTWSLAMIISPVLGMALLNLGFGVLCAVTTVLGIGSALLLLATKR